MKTTLNARLLLITSLALNGLLAGAGAYLLAQQPEDLNRQTPAIVCAPHTSLYGSEGPATNITVLTKPKQVLLCVRVDSESYTKYVANLGGGGRSEKAISETITGDLNDLFHWRARDRAYSIR
jgi:hypothetical protein